jgi:hypothetical protein
MTILSDYLAKKNATKEDGKALLTPAHNEIISTFKELEEVVDSSEIEWYEKYQIVFHTHKRRISPLSDLLRIRLDYYSQGGGYEDEIHNYMSAMKELIERF